MAVDSATANVGTSILPEDELQVFTEVKRHADIGFNETERRSLGKQRVGSISFNEADELFRGWIDENNWPYDALLFDPRVFTFIFEKTSRLIANKPRGKLIPRQSGDVISAKINNAILDAQWDQAIFGGSMISKWAMMDMNTRKYGSAFSLCKWRFEKGETGQVLYDNPEMKVLANRDCAHDLTATAIENANWFQVREYPSFQQLEAVNDNSRGKPIYKNLDRLREAIMKGSLAGGDTRGANWISRNRTISRIDPDPTGKDFVFKNVEVVTEYRRDRWITFSPRHGLVLRDIPNPYNNNEIPIVMLRYYSIDDDLYGLSEIESVKGLQKAINALLCQYVDEINQKLYTPIAVGPGVRQHTLEWGKGARWMMNNPMTDFRLVEANTNGAALFEKTYSVLVSAMMSALGQSSLGVSNLGPFQKEKTATEVKQLNQQSNARDQFNQIFLAEAIQRQMKLWYSMNQKMLFADETKKYYIFRIVGKEFIDEFQQLGLDQNTLPTEALTAMFAEGTTDPTNYMMPKYPVNIGDEKKPNMQAKMKVNKNIDTAELLIQPQDLQGTFDFIADVESMTNDYDNQKKQARQAAISLLVSNPNVLQLLGMEGFQPKFKELFVDWLEDMGFSDADKYFTPVQNAGAGVPPMPGQPGQATPPPPMGGQPPMGGGGQPQQGALPAGLEKIFPLDRNANVESPFSQFGVAGPANPQGGMQGGL